MTIEGYRGNNYRHLYAGRLPGDHLAAVSVASEDKRTAIHSSVGSIASWVLHDGDPLHKLLSVCVVLFGHGASRSASETVAGSVGRAITGFQYGEEDALLMAARVHDLSPIDNSRGGFKIPAIMVARFQTPALIAEKTPCKMVLLHTSTSRESSPWNWTQVWIGLKEETELTGFVQVHVAGLRAQAVVQDSVIAAAKALWRMDEG